MSSTVVHLEGLTRSFVQGEVTIEVLRGVNMDIKAGEIVALLGPSGSGKSTMLQAIGLLEGGFGGKIAIAGNDASSLDGDGRTLLRRDHIGFVYQFHHLLPDFTALENVVIPQLIAEVSRDAADERAVLCTPGDVDEFVEAVTGLVRHPELWPTLGRNARKALLENFTWERHVAKIWTHLLKQPGAGKEFA